jgi:hypothetical protein
VEMAGMIGFAPRADSEAAEEDPADTDGDDPADLDE